MKQATSILLAAMHYMSRLSKQGLGEGAGAYPSLHWTKGGETPWAGCQSVAGQNHRQTPSCTPRKYIILKTTDVQHCGVWEETGEPTGNAHVQENMKAS